MNAGEVFRPFRADHRRVLGRLDEVECVMKARRRHGVGPRATAVLIEFSAYLTSQFATHMRTEEDVLFPALAEYLPEAVPSLEPLRSEHAELRSMLERLVDLLAQPAGPRRDEQISVDVRDFVDLLRIHIHKEEAAVFGVAARVLTPREIGQMAARIADHRKSPKQPNAARARAKGRKT